MNRLERLEDLCWQTVFGSKKYRDSQLVLHMILKSAWLLKDEALLTLVNQRLQIDTIAPSNLEFIGLRSGSHAGFASIARLITQQAISGIVSELAKFKLGPRTPSLVQALDFLEVYKPGRAVMRQVYAVEPTPTILRFHARIAVREERWSDAWDLMTQSLEKAPSDFRTYADMGEVALYLDEPLERIDSLLRKRAAEQVTALGYDRLLGLRYMLLADDIAYLKLRGKQVSNLIAYDEYGKQTRRSMGIYASPLSKSNRTGFVIGRDGVSDEIRWSFYYPIIREYYRTLDISCDPRLIELFRRSYPGISFHPVTRNWGRSQMAEQEISRDKIPHLELASRLDNNSYSVSLKSEEVMFIEDVAVRTWMTFQRESKMNRKKKFLIPNSERATFWKEELSQKMRNPSHLRVGLVWRSSLIDAERSRHYMQLSDFAPLLDLPIEFFSIQHLTNRAEELEGQKMGVHFLDEKKIDLYNDFEEIAALTSALDLVIGVSTLPYEMAAAVGVPCLLCAISPQGRWMRLGVAGEKADRLTQNGLVFYPRDPVKYSSSRSERVESIISQIYEYVAGLQLLE